MGDYAAILVPPSIHQRILKILTEKKLKFKVTQEDIQKDIDNERVVELKSKKHLAALSNLIQHNLTWDSYHGQSDIESYYR